jgi:hypothetical protein
MKEDFSKRIIRSIIIAVSCIVGGYVGILFLIDSNGFLPMIILGSLLVILGLVGMVAVVVKNVLYLYKENVSHYDNNTRNWTAVLILISFTIVFLIFRYTGMLD